MADCNADAAVAPQSCSSQTDVFVACALNRGTLRCDPSGVAVLLGCYSELQPVLVCTACIPARNETACLACEKQSCCDESKAFYSDRNFAPFQECANTCTDPQCSQSCVDRYPSVLSTSFALQQCRETHCTNQCP